MTTPLDIAKATLSAALRDPRVGFAIKASIMGGAYEAFLDKIADAIQTERMQWQGVAEASFDEGVHQAKENRDEA
jgi:hypothetical protein